jgi:hypothetical protein
MARDIAIDSMVSLPRLTGESATTLAEQLLFAAEQEKGEGLPQSIERPRVRLRAATDSLAFTLQPKETPDSKACLLADFAEDDAWRSLSNWMSGLSTLPDGSYPELDRMRTLHRLLFGEGLSFLKLTFREEWAASKNRIDAMADGGYEPLIEKLGGGPVLTALKNAQKRYGEVLGINAEMKVKESPAVGENLRNLIGVMKTYVVKAAAHADPDEPGSEELSTALLMPLLQWKETRPSNRDEETETEQSNSAAS